MQTYTLLCVTEVKGTTKVGEKRRMVVGRGAFGSDGGGCRGSDGDGGKRERRKEGKRRKGQTETTTVVAEVASQCAAAAK